MSSRPPERRTGWKVVRLSQVPEVTRQRVANRIIRVEGLVGVDALDLMLAATLPMQDPWLIVPEEVARKVLGR